MSGVKKVSRVRASALFIIGVLVAAVFVAAPLPSSQTPTASAAGFNPGNIIDDAVFYNSYAMTETEIRNFISSKGASCKGGSLCLKNYTVTTTNRAADAMCDAYSGAANETAARIIYKVARACGINPQVLLVMLEKEQSLVTMTYPTQGRYNIAMGYGCPDTAPCDTAYYGLFNQLYKAGSQLIRYTNPPGTSKYFTWFGPGKTVPIQWHPNSSCGTSNVYVANKATASLYYYTPYQPNAAALKAGWGTGDSCSAYGNRNFYNFFTSWFGSTTGAVQVGEPLAPQLSSLHTSSGGNGGSLGPATDTALTYADGGVGQEFANGWAYWHASTGAYSTYGNIGRSYIALAGPNGFLKYPVAALRSEFGGESMQYQNGSLYYSPTLGIHYALTSIDTLFRSSGGVGGPLGHPTNSTVTNSDGSVEQSFAKGWIYQPKGGVPIIVSGAVGSAYSALGGPKGVLGLPTGPLRSEAGGNSQSFAKGTLYWSASTGTHYVLSALAGEFEKQGGVSGKLGFPAGDTVSYSGGVLGQKFENGWLYWSSAKGFVQTSGQIGRSFDALKGPEGILGYPVAAQKSEVGGGVSQAFSKGSLFHSSSKGIHFMLSAMSTEYAKQGGVGGKLGHPIDSTKTYSDSSMSQKFENGWLYWSSAKGFVQTSGQIGRSFDALKGPEGILGYPVAAQKSEVGGGVSQAFSKGSLFHSSSKGIHFMLSAMSTEYAKQGGVGGKLGHPIDSTKTYSDSSMSQKFENGWLYWSSAKGFVQTSGQIGRSFDALKGPEGILGYPVAAQKSEVGGGVSQAFSKGSLFHSSSKGIHFMLSAMSTEYAKQGGVGGKLGHPIDSTKTYSDSSMSQKFENGWLYWSSAKGFVQTSGQIGRSFDALKGPEGILGYPVAAQKSEVGGGVSQAFSKGSLFHSSSKGIHFMLSAMSTEYAKQGGVGGKLGHPIDSTKTYSDSSMSQKFENGTLNISASGAVTIG